MRPGPKPISPAERFERFYMGEPNSGCWLWTGGVDPHGYGNFNGGKAHRFSYELHNGPIPEGQNVLHRCDVPCCVNPRHLRLGSQADNMADMIAKGRHAVGSRKKNTHLTDDDVRAIRASTEKLAPLAERYGVGLMTISEIRRRVRWKHVQ